MYDLSSLMTWNYHNYTRTSHCKCDLKIDSHWLELIKRRNKHFVQQGEININITRQSIFRSIFTTKYAQRVKRELKEKSFWQSQKTEIELFSNSNFSEVKCFTTSHPTMLWSCHSILWWQMSFITQSSSWCGSHSC